MRASSVNSATTGEPSTWPLMPMRTAAGRKAAQSLAGRLSGQGVDVRIVTLPAGHDPNSFFVQGGDAHQFQSLLEAAR